MSDAYAFDRESARRIADETRRARSSLTDPTAPEESPAKLESDIRFCLTPAGGIPAMTVDNTTSPPTRIPGSALCDCYYGEFDPDSDNRKLKAAESSEGTHRELVCNLSLCPIEEGVFAPIWRSNDGTLFASWAKPTVDILTVKADECIPLGSDDRTATVQKQSTGGGWEDDESYAESLTIDNTDCRLYAKTGEIFQVIRASSCSATDQRWVPSGTFGLTRRVSVGSVIAHGSYGDATVISIDDAESCDDAETDEYDCTITIHNRTGRAIAVDVESPAVEKLTVHAIGCCWIAEPTPRAVVAHIQNSASYEMEPTSTSKPVQSSTCEFIEYPTWPGIKPSSVRNPFKHCCCKSALIEIRWDERTADWYVSDVLGHSVGIVTDVDYYGTNPPALRKTLWTPCRIENAGPGACEDPIQQDIVALTATTFVEDVYVDGSNLKQDLANVWAFGKTGDATDTIIGLTACP